MYKPDTTRLAQFWSTFQVIGVTDHGVRTSHWYSACHPYTWTLPLSCTDHQRFTRRQWIIYSTKYSFHLGHMVFTLWKSSSNSSGYNRTQVIQSWPSNMKTSAIVPSQIKLHPSPAGGCVLAMSCDYRVSQQKFYKYKKILQMTQIKIKYKNSFVGIFLCSYNLNLAAQTLYRRALSSIGFQSSGDAVSRV